MFETRGSDIIRTTVSDVRTSSALLYLKANIEQGRLLASIKKNSVKIGGM